MMKLGYRPALDGLRGISILAVMAYHSGLLVGGWAGVDVFFTLSGFLITTLLLEEHAAAGRFSFTKFYARRALRLLPALFVLVGFWGSVLVVQHPDFWVLTAIYIAAVLFYVANWAIIAGLPLGIFGHAWSLGIEEQFYMLWPPLLWFTIRWRRPDGALSAAVFIAAFATVAYRVAMATGGANVSFSRLSGGLDTRADSLLIGCALGVAFVSGLLSTLTAGVGVAAGLAALGALLMIFVVVPSPYMAVLPPSHPWLFAGTTTLPSTATALIILGALMPMGPVRRMLGASGLVQIGRISYGLYLWHFPVFAFTGALSRDAVTVAPAAIVVLAWGITFAVASVSFFLVERPALRLRPRSARPVADKLAGTKPSPTAAR